MNNTNNRTIIIKWLFIIVLGSILEILFHILFNKENDILLIILSVFIIIPLCNVFYNFAINRKPK